MMSAPVQHLLVRSHAFGKRPLSPDHVAEAPDEHWALLAQTARDPPVANCARWFRGALFGKTHGETKRASTHLGIPGDA